MKTPIVDFVKNYAESEYTRLHMPGHKGRNLLGFENLDITEIQGADALYEADGIIAESERNATELFGSGMTFYSTEGSSQCVRAMLFLALQSIQKVDGKKPVVVAARNVHKAFVYAAALLDFDVEWVYPKEESSILRCHITPQDLEEVIKRLPEKPAAVYVTSPDYLGYIQDIEGLSKVAHAYDTLLLVDNAHGAYLHFLKESKHPLDLGADLCCDSAHKTLPVVTGGAYLHISRRLTDSQEEVLSKQLLGSQEDEKLSKNNYQITCTLAKNALALFGSTSPSYLILQSLDAANGYLCSYGEKLEKYISCIEKTKKVLKQAGYRILASDPLRISLELNGKWYQKKLSEHQIECEFADQDYLVLMLTPENGEEDLLKCQKALLSIGAGNFEAIKQDSDEFDQETLDVILKDSDNDFATRNEVGIGGVVQLQKAERILSIHEAVFAKSQSIPVKHALGRICASPTVACPPAIPIVISGERITAEAISLFEYYGISEILVTDEYK